MRRLSDFWRVFNPGPARTVSDTFCPHHFNGPFMPINPVLTHTLNLNDYRPVLQSARLRHAIRAALFGTALGLAAVPQLCAAAGNSPSEPSLCNSGGPTGRRTQSRSLARPALPCQVRLSSPMACNRTACEGSMLPTRRCADCSMAAAWKRSARMDVAMCCRHSPRKPPCHYQTLISVGSPSAMRWAAWRVTTPPTARWRPRPARRWWKPLNPSRWLLASRWMTRAPQTVAQAMRYTPGVLTNPYGATHRYDYVAMRGFNDGSVDNIYVDGLKSMGDNGTYSTMQVDPYFLERIDILKGPSSVLYGRSSPGGLVALTTKKPLFTPYHQVQATVGTQGQRGMGFDFSGPVDDDKRIAYRLTRPGGCVRHPVRPQQEEQLHHRSGNQRRLHRRHLAHASGLPAARP